MGRRPRMTVSTKLAALAGTGVLVTLVIGIVTFVSLDTVRSTSDLRIVLNKANAALIDLDMRQSNVRIAERDTLLATTDAARTAATGEYAGIRRAVDADLSTLAGLAVPAEVRTALAGLRTGFGGYLSAVDTGMATLAVTDPAGEPAARALRDEAARADAIEQKISATRDVTQRQIDRARAASEGAMAAFRTAIVAAVVLGLAALVGVSLLVARSVRRPPPRTAAAPGQVTRRDPATAVEAGGRAEIAQLVTALAHTVTAMREAIATVGATSSALAGASDELTAIAARLGEDGTATGTAGHRVAETAGGTARRSATGAYGSRVAEGDRRRAAYHPPSDMSSL